MLFPSACQLSHSDHRPHLAPIADPQLSLWVGTELLQISTAPARALAIVGFVNTVRECISLRNFNDAFALMAGLSAACIRRLTVRRRAALILLLSRADGTMLIEPTFC